MLEKPTTGQWLLTVFLLSIPIVNIILLFIWAFTEGDFRKNFARAWLIFNGILLVLLGFVLVIMFLIGMSFSGGY